MSIDASQKMANWIRRVVTDGVQAADQLIKASDTASGYVVNAYNGGDKVNRPEYEITDAVLIAAGFPHLSAQKLNAFIGGLEAIKATYDANAGVIEAGRP